MKFIIFILILYSNVYGQDTLEFHTTEFDLGVKNYTLQKSRNNEEWLIDSVINPKQQPDSNIYKIKITKGLYYKLISNMLSNRSYTIAFYNNKNAIMSVIPKSTKDTPLIIPLIF